MPYTEQITDVDPAVRTYYWVTIYYKVSNASKTYIFIVSSGEGGLS